MATIKLCDWTKERLGKNEDTHVVVVGDQEFEVGEEGRQLLLKQLEGDETLGVVEEAAPAPPSEPREPPPPSLQASQPGGVQIQVADEPFEPGPSSMPESPRANHSEAPVEPVDLADEDPSNLLEIPDDPKRRFRVPTAKLAERIIDEATRFEEGTLPSLTVGAKQQRDASKRLKALEAKQEEKLQRRAGENVNFNKRGF